MTQRSIRLNDVTFGNDQPMVVIAGPCALETAQQAVDIAGQLAQDCRANNCGFVFKASFDKANRSSGTSYRGPGVEIGLKMLAEVKSEIGCPILTDIHIPEQAEPVAEIADIIQIPALLSRQTDLIIAAAKTSKPINIKKGQFMAPKDMHNVIGKAREAGNEDVILTERGTSFGYHNLVVDMRGIAQMRSTGAPVIIDATHSVQLPSGQGDTSDGDRRLAPVIARAAIAQGIAGVFAETHPDPDNAPCDGPNMIALSDMALFIKTLKSFDLVAKANPIEISD